jgi:hypothetical protein
MSLLCVVTIVFGVLLGYHGYNAHMERCNPELDAKIVRALSVCGEVPAKPPRYDPRMN